MAGESLIEALVRKKPVITDGGWGTELQARGLEAGEFADFWNLSHPARVEEVARAYVYAGSRIVLTNTFRANRLALEGHPEQDKVCDVNRAGVEISRRAASGRALVFASIGPSGKMLLTGQTSEAELAAVFREQACALAEGGADALVVETMADLCEARIAVEAALATGLPVVGCMVFDSGKNKDRTMMGVTPQQAAGELTRIGVHAVGANCGVGIEECIPICAALHAATEKPIWIKPNAGIPQLVGGKVVYEMTAEAFADRSCALVEAGASFVGGCCGTNPEFVKALCRRLNREPVA